MRRLSIAIALSTLLLITISSAQQTAQNTPPHPAQQNPVSPELSFYLSGGGSGGYFGLWNPQQMNTTVMATAPMHKTPNCTVDSCLVIDQGPLDVEGSSPFYEILGSQVLGIGSSGDENLFLGVGAGANNQTGFGNNTFAGQRAGYSNMTGTSDTFYGHHAGDNNTTGSYNVFVGTGAGENNVGGNDNTIAGYQSGYNSNSGTDNAFYGYKAGIQNTTGSFNTYVGDQAGVNNVGSGNTYLGYEAGQHQTSESNTMRLGADAQTNATFIAGVFGTTVTSGIPVLISNEGQVGTMTSSLRFKEQVRDMGDSTNGLMKLRPVTFFYKPEYANGQHALEYGLIAEEVAKVYPELVAYDKDGKAYTVRYQYISTMLLNEVQKQYHRAEAEAELIKAQQQEIDGLKQQLQVQNAALQERLSRLERLAQVERAAAH